MSKRKFTEWQIQALYTLNRKGGHYGFYGGMGNTLKSLSKMGLVEYERVVSRSSSNFPHGIIGYGARFTKKGKGVAMGLVRRKWKQ
jgi:hypothetical protein